VLQTQVKQLKNAVAEVTIKTTIKQLLNSYLVRE
jgi:hypothetical protein